MSENSEKIEKSDRPFLDRRLLLLENVSSTCDPRSGSRNGIFRSS